MNICPQCKKEKEPYHGRKCKECRAKYNRKISDRIYEKSCVFCRKIFIGRSKECSRKCKIMNRTIRNNCWEWQGKINESGYGCFQENIEGKRYYLIAHRISYEEFIGDIPKNKCVCHSCDNPKCCNPEHLWIGTHKENIHDCINKGRRNNQYTKGK